MRIVLMGVVGVVLLTGCAGNKVNPVAVVEAGSRSPVDKLLMFDAKTSEPVTFEQVVERMLEADVIILGEQHDDPMAHATQLVLFRELNMLEPGTALSMEMLERDEQGYVDQYLAGEIGARKLASLTKSANWGAKGGWHKWYGRIVATAKARGARVVAANAPRKYSRKAHKEGYEALKELPAEEQAYFTLAQPMHRGEYFDNFHALFAPAQKDEPEEEADSDEGEAEGEAQEETESDASGEEKAEEKDDDHMSMSEEKIENYYRSQLVWDATMASSIAKALQTGSKKVLHLVGRFHCDNNGGTPELVHRYAPDARVLVISMSPGTPEDGVLAEDDTGRADIVIYTTVPEAE